ncbi:MAG: sialidase family protein [Chloroflexota bacterium]
MITQTQREKLTQFAQTLVNQEQAKVIIPANEPLSGFWFGGGNMVEAPDGTLYLVGRYRNHGDSRMGLKLGQRGLEMVIFESRDKGKTFTKMFSLAKTDLNVGERTVLSIEGTALRFTDTDVEGEGGVELFISTEKDNIGYPDVVSGFLKPGTGVWTIDYMQADSVAGLQHAQIQPLLECRDPRYLNVKDPFWFEQANGDLLLGFVTHPFNWTSSVACYARRAAGSGGSSNGSTQFDEPVYDFFPRGVTWDVAMSRVTAWMRVPQVGVFADTEPQTLLFYDGGESMRNMQEHEQAIKRPRGYSCEELGGVAVAGSDGISDFERLSIYAPLLVSPHGFGTSRYVDVLETADGYYAIWQQSQPDFSQPLVMNFVSRVEAEAILVG